MNGPPPSPSLPANDCHAAPEVVKPEIPLAVVGRRGGGGGGDLRQLGLEAADLEVVLARQEPARGLP